MIIFGAQGLAKQMLAQLERNNYKTLYFFDDVNDIERLYEYPILKSQEALIGKLKKGEPYIIGIGGTKNRERIYDVYQRYASPEPLIFDDARISAYSQISKTGVVILSGVLIEPDATIGKCVLVNVGASITHDVKVGEFSEIGPGAILLGRCEIGHGVSIGAGAVILPNVKVGDNATVGAGAVVTRDVEAERIVVGVPAKRIDKQ